MVVLSLEELALRVQGGEVSLLREIVERFRPLIESLAKKYSFKGGSYEDLRQEGYLTLIKLVYRYKRGEVRLEGYVKGSLERYIRSFWLKELRWRKGVVFDDEWIFKEAPGQGKGELPLSDEERRLLELYYLWGYNDKHISEKLKRSRSWVNAKRRKIVERLKREIT
ncbi:MAG: RNA polymerase sigma factor, sigma-70 family [bacterium 42_11]|nr:MAG: RNA polymerase sigma factor, sigma-70 family [bacterium 42_11]